MGDCIHVIEANDVQIKKNILLPYDVPLEFLLD